MSKVADCGGRRGQTPEPRARMTWATISPLPPRHWPQQTSPISRAVSQSPAHTAPAQGPLLLLKLGNISPPAGSITPRGAPSPHPAAGQRPSSPVMMGGCRAFAPSKVQVPTASHKLSIRGHTQFNHLLATEVLLLSPTVSGTSSIWFGIRRLELEFCFYQFSLGDQGMLPNVPEPELSHP